MFSYEKLEGALKEKGISKTMLSEDLGLSSRTVAKIAKGEKLSRRSIQKIADYLGLQPDDIAREISDNLILQTLRDEKELKEKERSIRPVMYEQFCSDVVNYLKDHRMTQQQFADMVGLSRWSLNRYINGEQIPKTSTMRHIYKIMNIDI